MRTWVIPYDYLREIIPLYRTVSFSKAMVTSRYTYPADARKSFKYCKNEAMQKLAQKCIVKNKPFDNKYKYDSLVLEFFKRERKTKGACFLPESSYCSSLFWCLVLHLIYSNTKARYPNSNDPPQYHTHATREPLNITLFPIHDFQGLLMLEKLLNICVPDAGWLMYTINMSE